MDKQPLLKDIKITNFRSLVDVKVDFNTNLTTLIGINGAGKTNIMSGILLLKELFHVNSSPYDKSKLAKYAKEDTAHSIVEATFYVDGAHFKLKADLYFDSNQENNPIVSYDIKLRSLNLKPSRWTKLSENGIFFVQYMSRQENHARGREFSASFLKKYLTKDESLNDGFIKLIKIMRKLTYYGATQFSDPTKSPVSLELSNDRLINSSGRHAVNHYNLVYDLFRLNKFKTNAFEQFLNVVGTNGLALIDNLEFSEYEAPSNSYKVLAGGHIKEIQRKRTIVVPSFTVDKLQLSANQLSEGTFKTLALVFHILNDDTDIMLIEEPEVSVHHGLLGSILELIKIQASQKQIIMTTHSDYVLDKVDPENVVIVERTPEGTKAASISKSLSRNDFKALKMYLNEVGNLGDYWKEGGFLND